MNCPVIFLRLAAVAFTAGLAFSSASAEMPELSANGWHTWRVEAAEDAADWCCYQWNSGVSKQKACDLDGKRGGYSSSRKDGTVVEEIQVYALTDNGKLKTIRAFSAQCPVTTTNEMIDLGIVASDDSVEWLEHHVDPHTKLSSDVLAAISTHYGERPIAVLMDVVRHNSNIKNRKQALFWLAMSESDQAYEFLDGLLSSN